MAITPIQPGTREAKVVALLAFCGMSFDAMAGLSFGLYIAENDPVLAALLYEVFQPHKYETPSGNPGAQFIEDFRALLQTAGIEL